MLTAIIIDDEPESSNVLSKLLKEFVTFQVNVLGIARSLNEGISLIKAENPEIVFLDVDMPGESGMGIYKYFPKPSFRVVFVTAYSQFAINALKNSATYYLLKPVNFIELSEALSKVVEEVEEEQQVLELHDKIKKLCSAESEGKNIVLETESGFVMKNTRNIEYCLANESYAVIVTFLGKKIMITKPLKYLQEILPANTFYRTHKSYLVNINYIRKFVKASESYLLLRSGTMVPVSVRNSSQITNQIRQMLEN